MVAADVGRDKASQSRWREAIKRFYAPGPGHRVTRHVVTPSRIVVDGKHAYDYGTFEIAGERDGTA